MARIYDYICDNCKFEIDLKLKIEELNNDYFCPDCNSTMRRKIGMTYVVWQGLPPHREDEVGLAAKDLTSPETQARLREEHARKKDARGEKWTG